MHFDEGNGGALPQSFSLCTCAGYAEKRGRAEKTNPDVPCPFSVTGAFCAFDIF